MQYLRLFFLVFMGVLVIAASDAIGADVSDQQLAFFESKVRPVLVNHCYQCHSSDAKKLKAGLKLDDRLSLLNGGETGPAIVPGDPEKSLLIQAITYRSLDLEMPPKKKLPDQVIADLTAWVKMGAPWPDSGDVKVTSDTEKQYDWKKLRAENWAFTALKKPAPPTVKHQAWVSSPLDRFVLAKLERAGLQPAERADKRTLIRRATFDLTGLPPTPDEVDAFLKDERPDAFASVIDRLLASPHYGERWARHWLDVARYSDGLGGFLDNGALPHAWRYRDWVVNALNEDLPYDQFVKQQIAGDLRDVKNGAVATGFFAVGPTYRSDGGDPEAKAQAHAETLADRVDTFSRAFLALTVQCARCHDHPFDPIPHKDYYSLAGVFNNSRLSEYPVATVEQVKAYNDAQNAIKTLDQQIKKLTNEIKKANKGKIPPEKQQEIKKMQEELNQLRKEAPPKYPVAHALADGGKADMHVAIRGDLRKKGEIAPRRFMRIIQGEEPKRFTKGSGRLELADAVLQENNPLVARVIVNRVWQWHFGEAVVRTPSNFGKLGEKPTHPKLLDWLAMEFIKSGWSVKKLHRSIMLSSAYQMASSFDKNSFETDGDNRLLWRFNPRRLEVEPWRDAMLAVTGELDRAIGGNPTQGILASKRRTIYATISRNGDRFESDEFLRVFDFPSPRSSIASRATSTVPQQYLFLMNSPFILERAKAMATRLEKEIKDESGRIDRAYQLLFSRVPTDRERAIGLAFLKQEGGALSQWTKYAQVLLSSHEFMQLQ